MGEGNAVSDYSLSLYFKLAEGEKADLEVIAAAALHWVSAIKAAAEVIEPGTQIRVELVDADEASLRLNTILQQLEDHLARIQDGSGKYPRLRALALALAVFLITTGASKTIDKLLDPPVASLSDEDRDLLRRLLEEEDSTSELGEESRKFFRTLERDRSITHVGVAPGKTSPPVALIPRNQFAERGGLWRSEENEEERTHYSVLDVTLVSPVLLATQRSWTFQPVGLPPFKAIMKDKRFLHALEDDQVRERLRIGIPMTIRLMVRERKRPDGTWAVKPKGRSVIEVISPKID
jgi:hypothetical protein